MSHWIRTLSMFARRPWRQKARINAEFVTRFRVMPWDCDLNLHLTNSQYPLWLDLARTEFFLAIGSAPLFIRFGWRSVLASQTLTFIREIKPLAQVEVHSKVLHWDKKYFYMEHRFVVAGRLHAKALARVAVLKGGRVRSLGSMVEAVGRYRQETVEIPQPADADVPEQVLAKIGLLNAKREAEESR